MDFTSMALVMYPYWLLGMFSIWATIKSGNGNLVRVEKKPVFSWIKFLISVTLFRVVLFKLFPHNNEDAIAAVKSIPWPLTLTVFWEDACHGLPLLILMNFINMNKWWKWILAVPAIAMIMLEFGLGHVYQGVFAATFISFYIPYSIRLGKKYGFGTVMICHTLYDLATVLSLKFITGA